MAGPDDEIDGDPEAMLHWNVNACVLMEPSADLVPGMDEGKAYQKRDTAATTALVDFVTAAGHGANAYNMTARASGQDYVESDLNGVEEFEKIVTKVGVVSEWPPTTK